MNRGLRPRKQTDGEIVAAAIDRASENIGKWLATIALAAATPSDNSAEIQKQIDAATAELKASSDALEEDTKNAQPL